MALDNKIKEEVKKVLNKKLNKALKQGITMQYVEELRDRIVTRTRVGIGIDPETGRGERLKKLSKKYVKQRKKSKAIKRRNQADKRERKRAKAEKRDPKLSSKTTPGKSNLTATGQLLNSLTVIKLKLKDAWGFKISVPDNLRGRDFLGRPNKYGLTNRTLVKYLADQGRTFLGFTKSQRNIIAKEIRNFIIKGLK